MNCKSNGNGLGHDRSGSAGFGCERKQEQKLKVDKRQHDRKKHHDNFDGSLESGSDS